MEGKPDYNGIAIGEVGMIARRWIIRAMTAAALFAILCVIVGGVQ
jgi:hypothetical protein